MVSILITSQKYKTLPPSVRVPTTIFIVYNIAPIEWKSLCEEHVNRGVPSEIYKNVFIEKPKANFLIYNTENNKFYREFDELLIN